MERETVVDHGPYQARVTALAGGAIEARLDAWAAKHGEPVGGWRRVFGRLEPGRSPWAVLAYEADGGPTVRVLLGEPAAGDPLGPVEIARCTADPALPGLAPILAALDRAEVVRYRPGNRCTVHKRLAKVARTAAALRPDAEARASAHLDRLDLAGLGVDPVGAAPRLSRSASTRR